MAFYKCTASDDGCNFVLHVWCTRLSTGVKKKRVVDSRIVTLKLLPPVPFASRGLFRCLCCNLSCNGFVYSDEDKYFRSSYEVDVFCGVTPEFITHKSHPNHLLRRYKSSSEMYCRLCLSDAETEFFYGCEDCMFYLHQKCALLWPDTIRHKYDKHPMSLRYFPVENYGGDYFCEVCEEEFNPNDAFYHCDQCVYSIHLPCVEFIFQEATTWTPFLLDRGVDQFQNLKSRIFKGHPHPLSFFRGIESDGDCMLCGLGLHDSFILKCLRCKFAIHIYCCDKTDCATTSKKASMNAIQLNPGTSAASKNYKDSDHPLLLHLPFQDQTAAIKHFYGESGSRAFETNLKHPFHQHPLTLVDTTSPPTSSRRKTSSGHDPMKMVEVLCNACIRPITNMPFYKCATSDEGCNFILHAWCTRLPTEVKIKRSTYKLLPPVPFSSTILGLFTCCRCWLTCNGFVYSNEDKYSRSSDEVDVYCGVTPEYITHKSHPNHLLRKLEPSSEIYCRLCLSDAKSEFFYGCEDCNFYIHQKCALLWPETIRHKYDKHPMSLRYFTVENYGGDYFCEGCEEEFNPNDAFYHCDQCVYSIHLPCVESIPQEATTWAPFLLDIGVDQFQNVKFGGIFTLKGHPHPLSLFRGTESDGHCTLCAVRLKGWWILKCLQCKFAIDRYCCDKIE